MKYKKIIKVLSINHYIMGHATYQSILEQTFGKHIPDVEFHSLHLTDYFKGDFLGRALYWLLSKQLPGAEKADYDFHRFRTELATSFFARRCLERSLKDYQPDVIHIHTQAIAYLAAPLLKKFPSVVSVDYTAALLARDRPFPSSITCKPIVEVERRCFMASTHIITWSDRSRRSVIDDYGISPTKVTNIHPGVPLELFVDMIPTMRSAQGKPRLLFVGNDFVRKGGEDVLAVFRESLSDICELDIVSNAYVNLSGTTNVRLHRGIRTFSPEIIKLYTAADIFVMPTHEEVYGIVFTEAMAAGLPCVGTTVMTVPELVKDGVNGFTVKAGDRSALRAAILKLINDPELRLSMGQAGREIAKKLFYSTSNCNQIAKIFADISSGNK